MKAQDSRSGVVGEGYRTGRPYPAAILILARSALLFVGMRLRAALARCLGWLFRRAGSGIAGASPPYDSPPMRLGLSLDTLEPRIMLDGAYTALDPARSTAAQSAQAERDHHGVEDRRHHQKGDHRPDGHAVYVHQALGQGDGGA